MIDSNGLERLTQLLSPDRVSPLLRTRMRPRVTLMQKRGADRIPFSSASQGEQAATLLAMLMRQDGGPLLIDQPEEDLDNRVANEVVMRIRNAKNTRQLIFATRSANLVVNGDAEYVVELADGAILNSGAIDNQSVRDSITAVMEGGREAFDLRKKKYNF